MSSSSGEPKPELSQSSVSRLLAQEIARHLQTLEQHPDSLRPVLHALRGSAAMAGELELSLLLTQLGVRARAGDPASLDVARRVLGAALERLRQGVSALATRWPEPPDELQATPVSKERRAEYLSAMRDRIGELDTALANTRQPTRAIDLAYRSIHAMKSAASALGDDVTAWYCHGLESELSPARQSRTRARLALVELARHRAQLAALLEDPDRGLKLLRHLASSSAPPPSSGQQRPVSSVPGSDVLRVSPDAIDRLLDHVEQLGLVHDELATSSELAAQFGERMREQRASLVEALRLIGPARPWGAPAAALKRIEGAVRSLQSAGLIADRGGVTVSRSAGRIQSTASAARSELASLRRTTLAPLFDRLRRAAIDFADQELKLLQVQIVGGELTIDRRVSDRLEEPLLQLVKNAVAHGIENPDERSQNGKSRYGSLRLRAERLGDALTLSISDDGRGVDLGRLVSLSGKTVNMSSEEDALALLFAPGLTTRPAADLLAGRGVGLDLARETVRRLGGSITLTQGEGGGLVATVEVPSETRLVDVVWLHLGQDQFAVPVMAARRVLRLDPMRTSDTPSVASLAELVGSGGADTTLAVELRAGGSSCIFGIDGISEVETVNPRPLPSILARCGPYRGAVLRQDGSLRLLLECNLLVNLGRARIASSTS